MDKLQTITLTALDPALAILPARMDSPEARRMLLAIGLQESRFEHRKQIRGPAMGYWQFEFRGGVAGVMRHHATRDHVRTLCDALNYPIVPQVIYDALQHNDVMASGFARLLLWTLPAALPQDEGEGWAQYRSAWRPGKPHPETWPRCWGEADAFVFGAPGAAVAD